MKHTCPCGCGKEVPNGRFYANGKKCHRRGKKLGISMPRNGAVHAGERFRKNKKKLEAEYG